MLWAAPYKQVGQPSMLPLQLLPSHGQTSPLPPRWQQREGMPCVSVRMPPHFDTLASTQVLFLDSDATAAIDPTVLFEDANYRKRGSMFWPELWCVAGCTAGCR